MNENNINILLVKMDFIELVVWKPILFDRDMQIKPNEIFNIIYKHSLGWTEVCIALYNGGFRS